MFTTGTAASTNASLSVVPITNGGHTLDLTGVTLTATVAFRHPTIEALATVIVERPDIQVSLDVLSKEAAGLQFDSPIVPLVDQDRVVVTPHIGGSSVESQSKAAVIALRLMDAAMRESLRP